MEREQILKRINRVMQVEATVPYKTDFLLTHVPFENLFHGKNTPITENELLNNILLDNPELHKCIMVLGDNGSGKSHLIRWLYEKYIDRIDSDVEKVLLISRAHNTLQDTLMQILNADIFPEEIKKSELEKIKNAQTAITGTELRKTINFSFTLILDEDYEKKAKGTELELQYIGMLSSYLKNDYILKTFLMRKNGPLDRISNKLNSVDSTGIEDYEGEVFTEKDFDISLDQIKSYIEGGDNPANRYTQVLARKFYQNGNNIRKKAVNYLNSKVDEVIQKSLKLSSTDFQHLFESLRIKLKEQGMRLSLFVEDINAFTGIDLALMEVLIANHMAEGNEACCRLCSVVGSTIDFYDHKVPSSMKERFKKDGAEIRIREESLFKTQDDLVSFAAKYINACYVSDEDLKVWEENGWDEYAVPLAECTYEFASEICYEQKMNLFPFNRNAICHLYDCLDSHSKTPRRFLLDIIYPVLHQYYMQPEAFLDNENKFKKDSITSITDFISNEHNLYHNNSGGIDADRRSLLLRVWGDRTALATDTTLAGLSKEVFDAFGVEMLIERYPKVDGEKPIVPIIDGGGASGGAEPTPVIVTPPKEPITGASTISPAKKIEQNIGSWVKNSKQELAYHSELRGLVCRFIVGNMNWDVEEISQKVIDTYFGGNKSTYISIEGQSTAINEKGIVLPRDKETESFLYALIKFKYEGSNSWDFANGFEYYTIAATWLRNHKEQILKVVTSPYEDKCCYADMLIASLYCVRILNGGMNTKSTELIFDLLADTFKQGMSHGAVWNEIKEEVNEIEAPEKYLDGVIAYFSNAVGTAEVGETKYTFIDAYEVKKSIKRLQDMNWSLKTFIVSGNEMQKKDVWYNAPKIVSALYKQLDKMLMQEVKMARTYAQYFAEKITNSVDEKTVEMTFTKMQEYLRYIINRANLGYTEEHYKMIKDLKNARVLARELIKINELLDKSETEEQLIILGANPFEITSQIYSEFIHFDELLDEKNKKFNSGIDQGINEQLESYRKNILNSLNKLIAVGREVL